VNGANANGAATIGVMVTAMATMTTIITAINLFLLPPWRTPV
jgi:hypothetical protein